LFSRMVWSKKSLLFGIMLLRPWPSGEPHAPASSIPPSARNLSSQWMS
jgi:hypothetical protein